MADRLEKAIRAQREGLGEALMVGQSDEDDL